MTRRSGRGRRSNRPRFRQYLDAVLTEPVLMLLGIAFLLVCILAALLAMGCSGAGAAAGGVHTRPITTEVLPVSHPEAVPPRRPVPWPEADLRRFAEAVHAAGWDPDDQSPPEIKPQVPAQMAGKLRIVGESTTMTRRRPSEHPSLPEPVEPVGQPYPTHWTYDANTTPARTPDHQLPWKLCIYWEDEADDNRVSCSEESGAAERVTFTALVPGRVHEHPFLLKRMGRRYMGVIYENGRPYYEWSGTLIAAPLPKAP